jgi:hypothetical protein
MRLVASSTILKCGLRLRLTTKLGVDLKRQRDFAAKLETPLSTPGASVATKGEKFTT